MSNWTDDELVKLAQRAAATLVVSNAASLHNVLEGMDAEGADDEMVFCKALDRAAFECVRCNNWFEQVENVNRFTDGEWTCRECV